PRLMGPGSASHVEHRSVDERPDAFQDGIDVGDGDPARMPHRGAQPAFQPLDRADPQARCPTYMRWGSLPLTRGYTHRCIGRIHLGRNEKSSGPQRTVLNPRASIASRKAAGVKERTCWNWWNTHPQSGHMTWSSGRFSAGGVVTTTWPPVLTSRCCAA